MKLFAIALLLAATTWAQADSTCELRISETIGLKVVEFTSGNLVHSKMNLTESSAKAIEEEFINLQDEGICSSKKVPQKCILKLEKKPTVSLTLIRGKERWQSWKVNEKNAAQEYVKSLKALGFCS